MARLIRSSRRRKVSCRTDSAATASNKQRPPTDTERAPDAPASAESNPQDKLDRSAEFRADIRRRYDVPFGW
jgi:hypothetical protein